VQCLAITWNDFTVVPKAVGSDQEMLGGTDQQLKSTWGPFLIEEQAEENPGGDPDPRLQGVGRLVWGLPEKVCRCASPVAPSCAFSLWGGSSPGPALRR